jgi:predicted chitinase
VELYKKVSTVMQLIMAWILRAEAHSSRGRNAGDSYRYRGEGVMQYPGGVKSVEKQ